ncbi:macro domain-containing protein [Marinitoga litoralis]|uniref:macro domain-containing protein n=1 Tax=Marinitoga litoralis TaxID=570855 RepID=UPI00195F9DE5|nr:macro domain-containing protein [Marinitoga litoralis]MBM7560456.1 O-acetyl-ADP-ribose deacetylase (regulator of RNase III) [Marinitoga litoralis]
MIRLSPFSLFEFKNDVDVLVNTINTKGYMGKGLAFEFALRYPEMEKEYKGKCLRKEIKPGKIWFWEDKEIIANFPTKDDYKYPSKIEWISSGLLDLKEYIINNNIRKVALPMLGSGLGGLNWRVVEKEIVEKLYDLDAEIIICLDFQAGEKEKNAIENALYEIFNPLFGSNIKISRFREILEIKGVGKKRYMELLNKYF